ncbi:MAG TPA: methyltransferase [Azospirillaceae bacterium]|nr:methyltransferase [Azospirillaceae bacterium]
MTSLDITHDTLLGGRVRLAQPRRGYRAAVDPVLLAAAVPAQAGERVLDLGCGVGAAALCLAARVPGTSLVGLEMQSDLAELGRRNAADSGFGDRVAIMTGDLLRPPALGSFDRVMANPPYLRPGAHTAPPVDGRAMAHGEGEARLADWIAAARRLLKNKGWFTIIHRADRLDEIVALLHRERFGSLILFPLWPRAGEEARRVVVSARKGGRGPATLAAGLTLHGEGNAYTPRAEAVLRDAAPLLW